MVRISHFPPSSHLPLTDIKKKQGMNETLDTFNREWYEMKSRKEKTRAIAEDIYLQNQRLDCLRIQAQDAQEAAPRERGISLGEIFILCITNVCTGEKLIVDLKRLKKTLRRIRTRLANVEEEIKRS